MGAPIHRCVFTGRLADHLHHPTMRGPDGVRLDADFVVPVVRRQHDREHQSMTWSGLDEIDEPNRARLERTSHLLVRLGEFHAGGVVCLPAESVRQLGLMLRRVSGEVFG